MSRPRQSKRVHARNAHRCEERRSQALPLAALACIAVAMTAWTHWPALSARALSIDDAEYLTTNPLVTHPGWESTSRFFTEVRRPSTVIGYYHPLTMVSLMADYAMGGRPDDLRAFHRTSLLLHLSTVIAVIVSMQLLFRNVTAAVLAGLLFGLHPISVEPVVWLGQRKAVLAASFGLWSMATYLWYVARPRTWRLLVSLGLYVLALLSKPTLTPLPIMFLLLDAWPLRRWTRRTVMEKVPFLLVGAVFTLITVTSHIQTVDVTLPTDFPLARTPLMLCHKVFFYLKSVCWPVNMTSYYPAPEPLVLSNLAVAVGVIGTCGVAAVVLLTTLRTRAVAVGLLMFLVGLLPTLGIVGHSPVYVWDHYAYFPLVGFALIAAWVADRLWRRPGTAGGSGYTARILLVSVVVLVAVAEAATTRRLLRHWQDTEHHYRHAIAHAPRAPVLYLELGNYYSNQGRYAEAVEQYEAALRIYPEDADARNNLGIAYERAGSVEQAEQQYRQALRLRADHYEALCNLGALLARNGRHADAATHYRHALRVAPGSSMVHHKLGVELMALRQYEEADRHLAEALRLAPWRTAALRDRARLFAVQGRMSESVDVFADLVRREPNDVAARLTLAMGLLRTGRPGEAVVYLREAVRLAPDQPDPRITLAWVLATHPDDRIRNGPQALELADRARQLLPTPNVYSLDVLAAAFAETGQFDSAVRTIDQAIALAQQAGDTATIARLESRRRLYTQRLPYRESLPGPPPRPSAGSSGSGDQLGRSAG